MVAGGRNCVIIVPVQPTLEMWLEEGCTDTVEVAKTDESWEGEWNERGEVEGDFLP